MCGLTGILTRHGAGGLDAAVSRMTETLVHRGPDDRGVWTDEAAGVALGFRRLAILDLSREGHQPMRSADGRFTMVFNGEIYNYQELRRDLEASGVPFRGTSDTEVVLALMQRRGVEAALRELNGMFAIAIWDASQRLLHLARDPIGIKPLYVHAAAGWVTFGSEMKALFAAPVFARVIDRAALADYFRYLWIPAPRSIFRDVRKLRPGHLLTIADPDVVPESTPFWSLGAAVAAGQHEPFEGSDATAVAALEDLLQDAIARQMQSDVPLGGLLSGGVDSSTVVALMQARSTTPVRTFTIGFEDPSFDETAHANAVAKHLGTDHTVLRVTGREVLDVVPKLPEMFDEPFADPSQIPTYLVSTIARSRVTVALSGDGGDEVFAGYNRYTAGDRMDRIANRLPALVRSAVASGLLALSAGQWDRLASRWGSLVPSHRTRLPGDKLHKIARVLRAPGPKSVYRSLLGVNDNPEAWVRDAPSSTDLPTGVFDQAGHLPLLERMMLGDQQYYLPDDLLAKTDRASMAVSLEVRVPLLDTRVVEFGWRLPRTLRVRGGQGKWLLREVLYRHVPRALVDRPKMGFSVPIEHWLSGPLRDWGGDLVAGADRCDELNAPAVRAAWDAFLKAPASQTRGLAIWALCMYLDWRKRWLEQA